MARVFLQNIIEDLRFEDLPTKMMPKNRRFLILLTYIKKHYKTLKKVRPDLYRKPLLLTLVNSVNIEDADLKLSITNTRKRLLQAYNSKEINEELFSALKDKVLPIETLFIFGTNRTALETVIKELEQEKKKEGDVEFSLFMDENVKRHKLLIPTYKLAVHPLIKERDIAKFEITKNDYEILKKYAEFIGDDRIFLMSYNTEMEKIGILRKNLSSFDNFKTGEKAFNYNRVKVKIKLFLRPEDTAYALPEYKKYWFDNIDKMSEIVA